MQKEASKEGAASTNIVVKAFYQHLRRSVPATASSCRRVLFTSPSCHHAEPATGPRLPHCRAGAAKEPDKRSPPTAISDDGTDHHWYKLGTASKAWIRPPTR